MGGDVEQGSSPEGVATERTPGFDVARALAILGMVLVNFRGKMAAETAALPGILWLSDRLQGKAAALFVVLAGVGVSLRARRAYEERGARLSAERRALLERAAVLFVVGLLNLHLWEWDILHCYGVYLAIAAVVLGWAPRTWWVVAVAGVAAQIGLYSTLDWWDQPEFWSLRGMASDLFFNGDYPVFPWIAFVLVGMWLGRQDLRNPTVRRRILVVALVTAAAAEAADAVSRWDPAVVTNASVAEWLHTWPRPARPLFVVSGTGLAIATVCGCIEVTQGRADRPWVVALVATGQLAFTVYLAHVVAILIPLQHGLFEGASLEASIAYSLAFYVVAVAGAVWWRRRFARGPLEALIRQITGRTDPAPWGGAPLA